MKTIREVFLLIVIAFIISMVLVALAVAKGEKNEKETKKNKELFAPMQIKTPKK